MGLEDFLFDQHVHRSDLAGIQARQRAQGRRANRQDRRRVEQSERIERLEHDLGYVTLVLGALMAHLDEKGSLDRNDLRATLAELDGFDGLEDGKLDIDVLREMGE